MDIEIVRDASDEKKRVRSQRRAPISGTEASYHDPRPGKNIRKYIAQLESGNSEWKLASLKNMFTMSCSSAK